MYNAPHVILAQSLPSTQCMYSRTLDLCTALIGSTYPIRVGLTKLSRWAWQNSHLTRRIPEDQRITIRKTAKFTKGGRLRKRPARPRMSLSDKISNLHLLLRVSSFARWPLDVRFFCGKVYQAWLRYTGRSNIPIRNGIRILNPQSSGSCEIKDLSIDYTPLKAQLEQSISSLAEGESAQCAVCAKAIEPPATMAVMCPQEGCRAVSHMKCLADKFIIEEGEEGLVPTTGSCTACKANLRWIDLAKALSLRTRGKKDIAKLMRKPRGKNAEVPDNGKLPSSELMDTEINGDLDDDDNEDDTNDTDYEVCIEDVIDEPLIDEAGCRFEDRRDDIMSVTSAASDVSQSGTPAKVGTQTHRLEMVIEDSEQDEQDMIF